jgi:hypothetical protein
VGRGQFGAGRQLGRKVRGERAVGQQLAERAVQVSIDFGKGKGRHFYDPDPAGQALGDGAQQRRRTGAGYHKAARLVALLVNGHAQGGKELGEKLGFVDGHLAGIEAQEQVRVAGDDLEIAASLQVEDLPVIPQGAQQGGLAALARADKGSAGEVLQVLPEEGFIDPLHVLQFKMMYLKMQGIRCANDEPEEFRGKSRGFAGYQKTGPRPPGSFYIMRDLDPG